MEITRALCLSTSHITPETAKRLDADTLDIQPLTVWKSEHGWFFPCYGDKDESGLTGGAMVWPTDLVAVRNHALQAGCNFVRLDADGLVDLALPVYEWDKEEAA